MRTIERHLQQCLNRIEDWATRNGFKFSIFKKSQNPERDRKTSRAIEI